MRKLLLLLVAFCGLTIAGIAQSDTDNSLQEELKGTYQIQILKHSRAMMRLDDEVFTTIRDKRDTEKVVYHYINPKLRIMILPEKEIEAEEFEGVPHQKIVQRFE